MHPSLHRTKHNPELLYIKFARKEQTSLPPLAFKGKGYELLEITMISLGFYEDFLGLPSTS